MAEPKDKRAKEAVAEAKAYLAVTEAFASVPPHRRAVVLEAVRAVLDADEKVKRLGGGGVALIPPPTLTPQEPPDAP